MDRDYILLHPQVVFISSDGDEEAFEEYFATMPWTTLPYDESKLEEISANFGIAVSITPLMHSSLIGAN